MSGKCEKTIDLNQPLETWEWVPSGHRSTSQRWINVDSMLSFNFPQPSSMLVFGWEIVDFVTIPTKNQFLNLKSTKNQPTVNQISTISTSNLVDFWLNCGWEVDFWPKINQKSTNCQPNFDHFNFTLGWFLVELWLRSWFLVDHCYKINNFSTKYQRWGWLRKVEAQHWINVDLMLRSWSMPTGHSLQVSSGWFKSIVFSHLPDLVKNTIAYALTRSLYIAVR